MSESLRKKLKKTFNSNISITKTIQNSRKKTEKKIIRFCFTGSKDDVCFSFVKQMKPKPETVNNWNETFYKVRISRIKVYFL